MIPISLSTFLQLLPILLTSVEAHGYIVSPAARKPGAVFGAICGSQTLSQQSSDIYGNIQGELQVVGPGFDATKCNLWQCKGFQFSDQPASSIQKFTPGQVVPIKFEIRAPHDGVANISIVDTASNSVISELKSWDKYALTSRPIQDTEQNFDITIPSNLGSHCAQAGACVIQMFWDARSVDQTYESCIDFTVGGNGSGSGSGSSAAPIGSSSTIAASTQNTSKPSTTSIAVTTSATTNVIPISSSKATPSATSDVEIFTMTAGNSLLYCKEEL